MRERLLLNLEAFAGELLKEEQALAQLAPREENKEYESDLLKQHLGTEHQISPLEWRIYRLVGVAQMVQIQHLQFGIGSESIYEMANNAIELFHSYCKKKHLWED